MMMMCYGSCVSCWHSWQHKLSTSDLHSVLLQSSEPQTFLRRFLEREVHRLVLTYPLGVCQRERYLSSLSVLFGCVQHFTFLLPVCTQTYCLLSTHMVSRA